MAKALYRHTGTNQMVWVPVGFFDSSPLWELVDGGGGGGGGITQAELDAVEQDTTGPHGVADFDLLITGAEADSKVSAHNADITSVHGIADMTELITSADADDKVTAHSGASDPHGDRADTISKISTHAGASDPHGDRAWATPIIAGKVAKGELVISVDDAPYSAVGDGTTNDTAAIQAAITAATPGTTVVLGRGKTYSVAGLSIANKTNITLDGRGSELIWRATGSRIGLQFTGTCSNVTVQNFLITGNTVVGDAHAGIYCGSGQTLDGLRILNNRIVDVTLGISFSADGSGSLSDILIQGNHVENVIGTAGGTGYGLHHASSDTTTHQLVKFVNNTIIGAGRHGIYQAKGQGIVIQGNTIRDHRIGVNDGSFLSAIMIARSGDVTVTGNVMADGFDSAMTIGGVAGGTQARNYSVTGNVFATPQDNIPLLIIGQQDPSVDGYPDGVLVAANSFYTTTNGSAVSLLSGKKVRISNNLFTSTITSGTTSCVRIGPLDESAGTADYTDDLVVEGNSIYMATGGTKLPLNITGAETTGINMRFTNNRISAPGNMFQAPTTLTDPNIIVSGQPATGLTGPFLTEQANDVIRHPRITATTGTATPTPDTRIIEMYELTALNVNATFGAPTGTPADGQQLTIRIKDNGTARTLAWNAIYRAIGVTLPTTTVISKTMYVSARYNAADTKWDVLSVLQEA